MPFLSAPALFLPLSGLFARNGELAALPRPVPVLPGYL